LDDLIAYALLYAARTSDIVADPDTADPDTVVWHGPEGVTLLLDDADRRDRVIFPLVPSREQIALKGLEENTIAHDGFEQRPLIRFLRFELGLDNLPLLAKFRNLKFGLQSGQGSNLQHGKESIDRSIKEEILSAGAEALPETITVEVPLYDTYGERHKYLVRLGLEIDTANSLFHLRPLPGALNYAIDQHQADIGRRLKEALEETAVPVYFGAP